MSSTAGCPGCLPAPSCPARAGGRRRTTAPPRCRPDRLGGPALGGQPQSERADLGLEYPGVQVLGLPETWFLCGHGHGSLPVAHHPQPSVTQARDFKRHHHDREMARGTVPAAETGHRSETRISRWLNPGRRRTTDRVVGIVPACPPKCLPACGAALRLLPRSVDVPRCTVRIEHPAARLWPGVPSRPSSAC